MLLALLLVGCGEMESLSREVIGGRSTPDELGFAIDRFQRGAAAFISSNPCASLDSSPYSSGCSATLVGDRLLATAAHCFGPGYGTYPDHETIRQMDVRGRCVAVGYRADTRCVLELEAAYLHPWFDERERQMSHDFALAILPRSIIESCPGVTPIARRAEPVGPWIVGQRALLGGYGYTESGARPGFARWALLEVAGYTDDVVRVKRDLGDATLGAVKAGDSGSGLLLNVPGEGLRQIAVCSKATLSDLSTDDFTRTDNQGALWDAIVTDELLCGGVSEAGMCREGAVVACASGVGFRSDDCQARSEDCVVGKDGRARCLCLCDDHPWCEAGCACDPQCPCACDTTTSCQQKCSCDPECAAAGGCSVGRRPGRLPPLAAMVILGLLLCWRRRK